MRRALAGLVVLCLSALVGCTGGRLALPGDLRVGVVTDYPPLVYESHGRIMGVEVDLARLVGREIGRRVRLVPLERDQLIPELEQGRIDVVMAGMSVTPARGDRVRFIEPYVQVGQMALIRRDRVASLGRTVDLHRPGVRVGFVTGTTGETYVRKSLGQAEPVPFGSVAEGERALRNGDIDYFIHDAPTAWRLGADLSEQELMGLYKPLTEEWLAWAVRRNDTELASQLDALVARWRQDGTIERVINAWVPVRIIQ